MRATGSPVSTTLTRTSKRPLVRTAGRTSEIDLPIIVVRSRPAQRQAARFTYSIRKSAIQPPLWRTAVATETASGTASRAAHNGSASGATEGAAGLWGNRPAASVEGDGIGGGGAGLARLDRTGGTLRGLWRHRLDLRGCGSDSRSDPPASEPVQGSEGTAYTISILDV
jgi:hypothetical protein